MRVSVANHLGEDAGHLALRRDVYSGLQKTPKSLPPKWFYDTVGSELFDQITRLPEYYPTRAEAEILRARSAEVASACRADTLVELGSGTSEKTRMLLDALRHRGSLRRFVPFDVDASVLSATATAIQREYSGVEINAVCGDFEEHLTEIPRGGRRLFVFLGSTIGNLTPGPRAQFLTALAGVMRPGDSLLLGTDLVKDAARLVRAYDDPGGVTAQFNRNVLAVINRELEADFDVDAFQHVARWNSAEERIEMWLRADGRQRVRVGALDLTVDFDAGEEMLTEAMRRSGANSPAGDSLADRWRAARPPVAGLHLDSAACSRQSFAALDAAAQHARHEAEVGGYVAAEAAAAVLDAGRAAVAALSGLPDAEVVFTTGSLHALDLLLGSWPGENRTLACLPGEYGPNLAVMAAHGFDVRPLPTLQDGRVALDDAAFMLADDPPDLVHLTVVASHRGVAQPLAMVAQLCTELKLPLVVDAAQGLGHVDCAVGADVTYASSRKWIAGPRGVGVLAVRPELMERLRARLPAPDWMPPLTVAQQLGFGEANVAARVGFSVALGEHLACGPQAIRARLAELGDIARTVLADVSGWRVVEAVDEPSAITTLAPIDGADPAAVRAWLLSQRRIVTTYAGVERAPLELPAPVLRISPHVDNTADDLDAFAEALVAATAATSGER